MGSREADFEAWGPGVKGLAALQAAVDASTDVSDVERKANGRVLLLLFFLGRRLREMEVPEAWIRKRCIAVAPSLKITSTPWETVTQKYSSLIAQYMDGEAA
jgi:hypothetical protein